MEEQKQQEVDPKLAEVQAEFEKFAEYAKARGYFVDSEIVFTGKALISRPILAKLENNKQ